MKAAVVQSRNAQKCNAELCEAPGDCAFQHQTVAGQVLVFM